MSFDIITTRDGEQVAEVLDYIVTADGTRFAVVRIAGGVYWDGLGDMVTGIDLADLMVVAA